MKKIIGIILILILILISGVFFYKKERNITEIKVVKVKRGEITSGVSASGKVVSTKTLKISSKTGGKIVYLKKSEGDYVRCGELIAKIDDSELQAQLKQNLANLSLAKARYNQVKKGARKQEIEIAKQSLLQAKTNLEEAEKNLKRISALYQENFATEQQLDTAKSQKEIAETQLKQAEKQFELVSNKTTEDEIAIQEAQIKQQEAAIELIKTQIRNTSIYSPIFGKVLQKYVEEGEIIQPFVPILKIADMNSIFIDVNIDETEIGKIKLKDKVKIKTDSYPDKIFEGEVYYIADESLDVKEVGITFLCRIKLYEKNTPLKIGMSTDVEIITAVKKNVLYVPTDCIIEENGENFVYVVKENISRKRKVKTGISNEEFTEIKEGLKEGEIVAISNLDKLKDGGRVKL
jgi:multidrug efflux pump subunit AcrA (membrane-fusion protein)